MPTKWAYGTMKEALLPYAKMKVISKGRATTPRQESM